MGKGVLFRGVLNSGVSLYRERERFHCLSISLLTPSQPAGPLKRAGLLGVKHGGSHSSFGSQLSIYSSAGAGRGDYEISGEILLGIRCACVCISVCVCTVLYSQTLLTNWPNLYTICTELSENCVPTCEEPPLSNDR